MRTQKVSWKAITSFCNNVIVPTKPDLILGIHRGGVVLATMLSHRLQVPMDVIYTTRNSKTVKFPRIDIVSTYDKVLLVDDISDTGKSFEKVQEHLYQYATCLRVDTLSYCIKLGTTFIPDVYKRKFKDDVWIIFPWEIQ